ncbi:hypothetical protein B5X24_HaOG212482 [Helicoverpa armigera]|nr:hypothetical protein B5X24_HaOG212482 [Helicoverpa armigera]
MSLLTKIQYLGYTKNLSFRLFSVAFYNVIANRNNLPLLGITKRPNKLALVGSEREFPSSYVLAVSVGSKPGQRGRVLRRYRAGKALVGSR